MRIGGVPGPFPDAGDVPEALRAATERLGHRPAITVLRADRRDEQGFASLLKWTSKGAHLLELEALLDPGDRLALDTVPGWPAAAVCYAAWWAGVTVVIGGAGDVTVVHVDGGGATAEADYAIGDAFDGSPTTATTIEPWSVAVQTFPDQPPQPRAASDLPAVDLGVDAWDHAALLDRARSAPAEVDVTAAPDVWLPALARPLVTGEPTIVRTLAAS